MSVVVNILKSLTYVENLCRIPCGIYKPLEVSNKNKPVQISNFFEKIL